MKVTIIGSGYVGLVTGACLAELGNQVFCLDVDQKKIDILTEAREHFTYAGVLKQIEALMNDPFGPNGGYLRCIDHPRTERCCG